MLATLAAAVLAAAPVADVRSQAEALKARLPSYEGAVPVPDEATLFGWIEGICATPHRRPGTPEGHAGERWVAARFRELGLRDVRLDPVPIPVWTADRWSLTLDGSPVPCHFMLNTGLTPPAGVTAPLTYVGTGVGKVGPEVAGKIVVCDALIRPHADADPRRLYFASDPGRHFAGATGLSLPANLLGDFLKVPLLDVYAECVRRKAAGVVMVLDGYASAGCSLYWPYDGAVKPVPGLYAGKHNGPALREAAKAGKRATLVQTGRAVPGTMSNVWGVLPGASEECVLVTTHHDSPHKGAVEDGSGVAQVLGQAWAWSRVPKERRPRTLVFVAAAGHMVKGQGALEFARRHPDVMTRARAVLTLEHLPCKEVREGPNGRYAETGRPQASQVYTAADPAVVAAVWKAFDARPPLATAVGPPPISTPLTDAAGYVAWAREAKRPGGLPYASWISAPLYLLDEHDTLDKIDRGRLVPTAETVTELVKNFMVLPADAPPAPAKPSAFRAADHAVRHASAVPNFEGKPFTLAVREKGPDGPAAGAVLLVHGTTAAGRPVFDLPGTSWMDHLAGAGLRAFAVDLTGYGASTRPAPMDDPRNLNGLDRLTLKLPGGERPYPHQMTTVESDWHDIDAAVDFVRRHAKVERVGLVGVSLGAGRVLTYAARYPDKVGRVVAQGWSLAADFDRKPAKLPPSGSPLTVTTEAGFTKRWRAQVKDADQVEPCREAAAWAALAATDPLGATWGPGVMRSPTVALWGYTREGVRAVKAPTLLVVGEYEGQSDRKLYELLTPESKVHLTLAGASHFAFWESRRHALFRASAEWLRDGTAGGRRRGAAAVTRDGRFEWAE